MILIPSEVQDSHFEVLFSVVDGLIHETTADAIRPYVSNRIDEAKLQEYVKTVTKPSDIPEVREFIKTTINKSPSQTVQLFIVLMTVLSSRVLSPFLTNSTKLVTEMNNEEKQQLLLSWRNSPIEAKNKIFATFVKLAGSSFIANAPELHCEAIDYPKRESRKELYEGYVKDEYEYKFKQPPSSDNVELFIPEFDAVIVGSGAGAGVVAHTLARAGHKCLVLEKGAYFKPSDLNFDDVEGTKNLYEQGGMLTSTNAQIVALAGATFGGGTTVNWSACLKTPFKVRQEWYEDHGLDFVATEAYDNHIDYVLKQMGANKEYITHSKANSVLLEGARKLGYTAKAIEQNNGSHENHSCGFCHLGCKWGVKQGSLANWLRDAAENGTEFMERVKVEKVLRNKKNIAIGLECINMKNGFKFIIKGPKKFVLCGGSLNTPLVLQKSGFRNKHIGKNLKLHPITSLNAIWDEKKTDPFYHSIMTAMCSEVEDRDGKAHGSKIETLLHTPLLESVFLPWESSDQFRKDTLRYQSTTSFIMLTRDTSSGSVTHDPQKPDAIVMDYTVNKFDRESIAEGLLTGMDIVYIEGAVEIIHPFWKAGRFKSKKPKEQRSISDPDYQKFRNHCASLNLTTYGVPYGSAHQMSTCRMSGKGAKDGACDTSGRLFECDNIYVADASLMPTASGANPMVSTMALSRHVALALCKDLSPCPKL